LRLEDVSDRRDDEGDIIEHLGQLNFYAEKNLVREWMEYGRSNWEPILDEEDEDSDVPISSQLVTPKISKMLRVMIALVIRHEEMWVAFT
jgi:hypothetical protein